MAFYSWNGHICWQYSCWTEDSTWFVLEITPNVSLSHFPGAGYGLFAKNLIEPSSRLFTIPSSALLNSLTLSPHYPQTHPKLTCTQYISLHLFLHRPVSGYPSPDPLFGPYISVLPKNFDSHPLTWLWRQQCGRTESNIEIQLLDALPSQIMLKLNRVLDLFKKDLTRIQDYLVRCYYRSWWHFLDGKPTAKKSWRGGPEEKVTRS